MITFLGGGGRDVRFQCKFSLEFTNYKYVRELSIKHSQCVLSSVLNVPIDSIYVQQTPKALLYSIQFHNCQSIKVLKSP